MLGSRIDLHILDAGSVNGTRYCNEILPYERFFRGAMGLQFLFMDDNAPCHRTVVAEQLLESRRLAARTLPPVTIRELRLALQDEWAAMPQQLIDTLILSMGRRCETCLAVREILSPTKDRMFLAGHPSQGYFGLQSHCAPCYFFNQASYPSDFSFKKLTVWSALWAAGIIGPYFFNNDEGRNVTVNGDRYRAMITNCFIPELNNHDVQELWFQQDGATCHAARATIDLLKDTFGVRLISRFVPVNWPPRSCDLTPLHYFLWSYVMSWVYANKPQTFDHLEDNIRRVIA
ncbi:transposable element Tcb2 transposase [Trichonephila clavipes]|nr:transposable element Tcb2 transposase [Trichonephila clavipes]